MVLNDFLGSIRRTGIDDDPMIDEGQHIIQTTLDHPGLVLDDHIQADGLAGGKHVRPYQSFAYYSYRPAT